MKNKITMATAALTFLLAPVVHAEISDAPSVTQTRKVDQDSDWMVKATQGSLLEVRLGQLAMQKAKEQITKDLAADMVRDHTQSLNDLRVLAQSKRILIPTELNPDQALVFNYFNSSTSPDWGHDFVKFEIENHKKCIAETQLEITQGKNADVKQQANKMMPILQEHLQRAQAVDTELSK